MSPEVLDFLLKVGELTGDASVERGFAACLGAGVAVLATGWRMVRRRQPEDRVKIVVDAPPGESVSVRIGEHETGDR